MATTTNNPTIPNIAYKRIVAPTESLDGIACIAMVSGKPIADVLKVAVEKFKLRRTHGPYYIDEARLQMLFATFGFVASNYKEIASLSEVPDLALVWQDTDIEQGLGRVLLHHRMRDPGNPKQTLAYVIDPSPQTTDASRHVCADFSDLQLTWFMALTPLAKGITK